MLAVLLATVAVVLPPVHGTFDYQSGGPYAPRAGVQIVDRDHTEKPVKGLYDVCYVNGFQTQPESRAWWLAHHPSLVVRGADGTPVEDPGWPGEMIMDTSTAAKRAALATVVEPWIAACARKGFQAVEPDNLDSWSRSKGALTQADDLAFATTLIRFAHAHGLAIGQKNSPELGTLGKKAGFDFAIAEECQVFSECGAYTRVYGRHVIEVEYTDQPRRFFTAACKARGAKISILLRDRDVVAKGHKGYHYETCS